MAPLAILQLASSHDPESQAMMWRRTSLPTPQWGMGQCLGRVHVREWTMSWISPCSSCSSAGGFMAAGSEVGPGHREACIRFRFIE